MTEVDSNFIEQLKSKLADKDVPLDVKNAIVLAVAPYTAVQCSHGKVQDGRTMTGKFFGTMRAGAHEYCFGVLVNKSQSIFVSSSATGAAYVLKWDDVLRMAIAEGVNEPLPDAPLIII